MRRPVSFSEADIDILRDTENIKTDLDAFRLSKGLSTTLLPIVQEEKPVIPWYWTPHRWALRFSLHLTFISLFETIFFWHFVSVQENEALMKLVVSYTQGIWSSCGNITNNQRQELLWFLDLFLNSSMIESSANTAYDQRSEYNNTLLIYSWIYVGSISTVLVCLMVTAFWKKVPVRWGYIFGENLTLVFLLGLYELMFFKTVVLDYQSLSIPEIDEQLFTMFQNNC
jgi:hypothetical protein